MPQANHRSTSRVLDVFDLLSNTQDGYTLTEISQALSSPKSSMLPILQTLAARNYLDLNYRTGRYSIGPNLSFVGSLYRKRISINQFIDMEMHQITDITGESSYMGIRQGSQTLFIHTVDCEKPVECKKKVGMLEDGLTGAMGKALLCDLKLNELAKLVSEDAVDMPADDVNLFKVHVEMEETRVINVAYERGEVEGPIQAIASHIRYKGEIVAAIGVILPAFRINPKSASDAEKQLHVAVRKIENVLADTDEDISKIFSIDGFRNL